MGVAIRNYWGALALQWEATRTVGPFGNRRALLSAIYRLTMAFSHVMNPIPIILMGRFKAFFLLTAYIWLVRWLIAGAAV